MKNTWMLKEGVLLFMELESLLKHNEVMEKVKRVYNRVAEEVDVRIPAMMKVSKEIIELGRLAHLFPEEQGKEDKGSRRSDDSGREEDVQGTQKRPADEEGADPFEEANDSGYEENTAMKG